MNRSHLLRSTYIGRQGHAGLFGGMFATPQRMTANVAAAVDERKASDILAGIREAVETLGQRERVPSVIVVADAVPNGLVVEAGEVCFMTLSTEGLERIVQSARMTEAAVEGTRIDGVPVVILAKLYESEDPKLRKLGHYYAAAIQGARRAAGV